MNAMASVGRLAAPTKYSSAKIQSVSAAPMPVIAPLPRLTAATDNACRARIIKYLSVKHRAVPAAPIIKIVRLKPLTVVMRIAGQIAPQVKNSFVIKPRAGHVRKNNHGRV